MRVLLFIAYYAIALLMGFALRGKFDRWMYSKSHMQGRLRIFSHEILAAADEEGRNDPDMVFLPPPTLDALAFNAASANRQVAERENELYAQLSEASGEAEPGAEYEDQEGESEEDVPGAAEPGRSGA